ncbi:chemotaxis protein CheW [Desulfotalea psychrophila]|uniref:Related to purine-binding chemotaxis protein n=1 Tax=Desulfotalea psychrophila (strain LSv54 / DSM 12343) TaxID=177439 RepID=Q6AKN7_DESPS|nr:chemotaxis protein CheW [Desulfotalea psychrophila]CAG37088.1 related to purine-binding chemotaxis protein [Desulfotalea psychrophila LSv54]
MTKEQLFASFVLDHEQGLEIALRAEYVTEATPIQGTIQKLPGSIPFLEGVMHLRNEVIPVLNLKKRLGLSNSQYSNTAKVAVVTLREHRFGLLFEDIKEVFGVRPEAINPISKVLQTEDQIISALINVEPGKRAIELLDLNHLFKGDIEENTGAARGENGAQQAKPISYSRFVAFECAGQEYGVPVDLAREITFCAKIDELFKTGMTAGVIELRGRTIPILNTLALLTDDNDAQYEITEHTRVLVLACEDCTVGFIVDEIKEILSIPDEDILPFTAGENSNITGLYPRVGNNNTILLNMQNLVCDQIDNIKAMARIGEHDKKAAEEKQSTTNTTSHHLITENGYLVFSIGKNFALEIKDVKEIIENNTMMKIPKAMGHMRGMINLRGEVVPVVDLRRFYNYEPRRDDAMGKLIICNGHGQTVALEVDQIVTIYKKEQFHTTPSLGNQLRDKKDTLDRLIEYLNPDGINEHVLVVNTHNLIRNHLQMNSEQTADTENLATKNNTNSINEG